MILVMLRKDLMLSFGFSPIHFLFDQARGEILQKFADLIEQHEDELAYLESLDNGKPLFLSKYVDLKGSLKNLRSTAGIVLCMYVYIYVSTRGICMHASVYV
jgi:acyl-CoA reductase-like NAD-dependent aldehyde dehydrogenase